MACFLYDINSSEIKHQHVILPADKYGDTGNFHKVVLWFNSKDGVDQVENK